MFNNSKSSSHSSFRSQSLALAEVCIALVDIFSSYKLLEVREKERKILFEGVMKLRLLPVA